MSAEIHEYPMEAREIPIQSQEAIDKNEGLTVLEKDVKQDQGLGDGVSEPETIIVTGADASLHLLPLRDDFDSVLTLRSVILASGLACFQSLMPKSTVQTNRDQHSRNIHRAHLLFRRQRMGQTVSAW